MDALTFQLERVRDESEQEGKASRHVVQRLTLQADELVARLCAADALRLEMDAQISSLKVTHLFLFNSI